MTGIGEGRKNIKGLRELNGIYARKRKDKGRGRKTRQEKKKKGMNEVR